MRRSTSDRARGVMTRPIIHRRSGLFGTSIGTSFNGSTVLSCARHRCPRQYRLIRDGLRPCRASWAAVFPFRRVVRLPFDSGPFDQSRDRRDVPKPDVAAVIRLRGIARRSPSADVCIKRLPFRHSGLAQPTPKSLMEFQERSVVVRDVVPLRDRPRARTFERKILRQRRSCFRIVPRQGKFGR
jgi:hypothetical protein